MQARAVGRENLKNHILKVIKPTGAAHSFFRLIFGSSSEDYRKCCQSAENAVAWFLNCMARSFNCSDKPIDEPLEKFSFKEPEGKQIVLMFT